MPDAAAALRMATTPPVRRGIVVQGYPVDAVVRLAVSGDNDRAERAAAVGHVPDGEADGLIEEFPDDLGLEGCASVMVLS